MEQHVPLPHWRDKKSRSIRDHHTSEQQKMLPLTSPAFPLVAVQARHHQTSPFDWPIAPYDWPLPLSPLTRQEHSLGPLPAARGSPSDVGPRPGAWTSRSVRGAPSREIVARLLYLPPPAANIMLRNASQAAWARWQLRLCVLEFARVATCNSLYCTVFDFGMCSLSLRVQLTWYCVVRTTVITNNYWRRLHNASLYVQLHLNSWNGPNVRSPPVHVAGWNII